MNVADYEFVTPALPLVTYHGVFCKDPRNKNIYYCFIPIGGKRGNRGNQPSKALKNRCYPFCNPSRWGGYQSTLINLLRGYRKNG